MKKIEAIIRHCKLDDVRHALVKCGAQGMTVTEVRGWGQEKPCSETYRGVEHVAYVSKVKMGVVLEDEELNAAIDAILSAASTGHAGDGLICVIDLDNVIRIRTGEQQVIAVT